MWLPTHWSWGMTYNVRAVSFGYFVHILLQRGDKWKKNRIRYVLCAARTVCICLDFLRVKHDFSSVNVLMKLLFAGLKSLLWEHVMFNKHEMFDKRIKSIFVLLYSRPKPCQHKRPTRLSPLFLNFVYFCEFISNIWSQNVFFYFFCQNVS